MAPRLAGVQAPARDRTRDARFRALARGTFVAMGPRMRRRVQINSNGQPITIADEPRERPGTHEVELDCIHCRALRARGDAKRDSMSRRDESENPSAYDDAFWPASLVEGCDEIRAEQRPKLIRDGAQERTERARFDKVENRLSTRVGASALRH